MKKLCEIDSLSELWKHPEWKKKVNNFINNKCCEWCGRKKGYTYIDKKGKKRKVGLSPHHIEKHKWGLKLYNDVLNKLFRKWYSNEDSKNYYDVPRSLSKKEKRIYVKNLWKKDNLNKIKEEFEKRKREIIKEYIELSEDKIIILCNICHYAREKGLLICPTCKENYRKPNYNTCSECRFKTKINDKFDKKGIEKNEV